MRGELRDEHGWPINWHIDEELLRVDEYRLVSADPADRLDIRQRLYKEDVRERVFARDNYTCTACGRDRARALAAGDTRFYLEIHPTSARLRRSLTLCRPRSSIGRRTLSRFATPTM